MKSDEKTPPESPDIDYSGPRYDLGIDFLRLTGFQRLLKWLHKVSDDGADLDEVIARLEYARECAESPDYPS